jgi:transcriptional regulator with XRE-family HTH domain
MTFRGSTKSDTMTKKAKTPKRNRTNRRAPMRGQQSSKTLPGEITTAAARRPLKIAAFLEQLQKIRTAQRWTIERLSRTTSVSCKAIKEIERGNLSDTRFRDVTAIAIALGFRIIFEPIPKPPTTNPDVLASFDSLIASGNFNPFFRDQPDREHPEVLWDVVGDIKENWLYVIATNTRTKVRFGAVTDRPGGWAVAGQIWGIDVETNDICGQIADKILADHKKELVG